MPPPTPSLAPGAICDRCGQPHPRGCKAHRSKRDEDGKLIPCGQFPKKGFELCRTHGASAPAVARVAQQRVDERKARALAKSLGAPVDVDPREAILNEIRWAAGHVEFYRQQVMALDPEALIKGVRGVTRTTRTAGPLAGDETTQEAGPDVHLWLKLYGEERDRLTKLCLDAIKVGIEERRIKIAEASAAVLGQGLAWLQGEMRTRFEFGEIESRAFASLLSEMLRRVDALEARTPVP